MPICRTQIYFELSFEGLDPDVFSVPEDLVLLADGLFHSGHVEDNVATRRASCWNELQEDASDFS